MRPDTAHWVELQEFETCEPSPLAFRALVALLDSLPRDDQTAAIAYANQLLSHWPDAMRLAPWSWCKAASRGDLLPTWPLVRALELSSGHLSKGDVNLARLAHRASLEQITRLNLRWHSDFPDLSFLYHRPETFPALKQLRATDKFDDADVRALAESPLWQTLEHFEIEHLTDSLVHRQDASRIVPQFQGVNRIRHMTLRAPDLISVWEANHLPELRSVSVFIRSVEEAELLAAREELSWLHSLSIAFRCGFRGSSPSEPFLGNIIEPDEAAAEAFFESARLDQLERLEIVGYSMGYWGREGLGRLGLQALIASGLLHQVKQLRLHLLPLGDQGITDLAPALGTQLETLELPDVYCKGNGAATLIDSPCLRSLRHLDLSANRIDAGQITRLASVELLHLESLDLSGPPINPYYWDVGQQPVLDAGAIAWAGSPQARRLKRLGLANCCLTDAALSAIFQSPHLRHLEQLDLSHNSFTAAAISTAVVGSPLWQTLREVKLNDCRLDNAALNALVQVKNAPALRSLELAYNSIGPSGATALAGWSVLARVWQLNLHDNFIGDEGLIALATSPCLHRIVELDLEQDCWNSHTFTFNEQASSALANSTSLSRLDSLYSGCVDEYHGAAYSPGFTRQGLEAIRHSTWMRPAFKASCSDFSGISDYSESAGFNEEIEFFDHDFRAHPVTLNESEAQGTAHRMQQLRLPSVGQRANAAQQPPNISPLAPEAEFPEENIIEGIEYLDPTPAADYSLKLDLSLTDDRRPLPGQVGKFLADTLDSIYRACGWGSFGVRGSTSQQGADGQYIETDSSLSGGIQGDPQPAIRLLRETLWWIGAPEKTKLDQLTMTDEPEAPESRLLQLGSVKIARWKLQDRPGHRIDRVDFPAATRKNIQKLLTEYNATETGRGWVEVTTSDGGRVEVFVKYLDAPTEFNTLNLLVEQLTPEISALVHRLMREQAFLLFPMAFAASSAVAQTMDCDWPKVEVVESAEKLHTILARGPFAWWRQGRHS